MTNARKTTGGAFAARFRIALFAALASAAAAGAEGLGPGSYVQDGLVAQFDAIDNEGSGVHNPSATVWRDLKGTASIALKDGANWSGRFFDSTYANRHEMTGMPHYVRDSLTLEVAMRAIEWGSSYPRYAGHGDYVSFYHQNGHVYWYIGTGTPPHAGGFGDVGTIAGWSGASEYGIAFDGVAKDKVSSKVSGWLATKDYGTWYDGIWSLNGNSGGTMHGHYCAVRLYDRALAAAEMATNAVIDKLRFWSFRHESAGDAPEAWASISWETPDAAAATPRAAPESGTNDFVQVVGAKVVVSEDDTIALRGLSLENGATLSLPSGSRAAAKVLYVEGKPVKRGLYSGDGVDGVKADWLQGAGVMAVAGGGDGEFPSGTYAAPGEDGWYVFGLPSSEGGTTAYHSGAAKWYIRGERPDWSGRWFPEGAKLRLVGYVLLDTIPAGVFSEIDLSGAEHVLLCGDKAFSDGSALAVPAGVELRYQPATSISHDPGNGNYYLLSVGDAPETGDIALDGTLRVYGDGGGLLNSQHFTGAVSGTGTIQFGNFNKAARFSGPFTLKGGATGFNNASLLWVDSLEVDASLGDVALNNGGAYTANPSLNANGIFFGKDGSGETASGVLSIGRLDGQARNTSLRGGGALVVWGGNTIRVDSLKSALHVVGRPQDLGCTWGWFGSAAAVGAGNVEIGEADFTGNVYFSTNVNATVRDVPGRVAFDYATYVPAGSANPTTLDISGECNSGASVVATDLAALPARITGFTGDVRLVDSEAGEFTLPIDLSHGPDVLYNPVGCAGSGRLAAAPAASTVNVVFDTAAKPVVGEYAVARFSSGGEALSGWTVLLNGRNARGVEVGRRNVALRRDSTGIWLKVSEIRAFTLVVR